MGFSSSIGSQSTDWAWTIKGILCQNLLYIIACCQIWFAQILFAINFVTIVLVSVCHNESETAVLEFDMPDVTIEK